MEGLSTGRSYERARLANLGLRDCGGHFDRDRFDPRPVFETASLAQVSPTARDLRHAAIASFAVRLIQINVIKMS
jgi:hypothetical protein